MADSGPGGAATHPLSVQPLARATVAILRRHWEILWPLAAALFFLPQLLVGLVAPVAGQNATGTAAPGLATSIPLVLVGLLVVMATIAGQLAIAVIAVADGTGGRTVGEVLKGAARRMVPALAVVAVQSIAAIAGGLLFILPGLWLLARLSVALPIIATETDDPLAALRQSWDLTRGHALRILGCLAAMLALVLLLYLGVTGLGLATGALRPDTMNQPFPSWSTGRWLFEVASSAAVAASGLIATCFYARLLVVVRTLEGTVRG